MPIPWTDVPQPGKGAMDCQTDSTLERLVAVVRSQATLLQTMLKLTERLQQHLIAFDAPAIEQSAHEQELLLERLGEFESQRIALTAELLGITPSQARTITLRQLCAHMPEHVCTELSLLVTELGEQLKQLHLANSINRLLALRGRNSIQATLEFIRERNLHAINTAL